MPRYDALPPTLQPRGLCREAAAAYVGISPVKFDQMVTDGRMPQPKRIDARKVWDTHGIDLAFERLPQEVTSNPWDDVA